MKIEREWAMPNAWTFSILPISRLLLREGPQPPHERPWRGWADPFAGQCSPAEERNDLDPSLPRDRFEEGAAPLTTLFEAIGPMDHMDALEWLRRWEQECFAGVLYDPPYSISQAAEMYKSFGAAAFNPASMGYWASVKDEIARVVRPGGKAISCGWSSNGLGEGRGFEMTHILLVPHGGSKNDTIVTVEVKRQARLPIEETKL